MNEWQSFKPNVTVNVPINLSDIITKMNIGEAKIIEVKDNNGNIIGYKSDFDFDRLIWTLIDYGKENKLKTDELKLIEQLFKYPDLIPAMRHIENKRKPCTLIEGHEDKSGLSTEDVKNILLECRENSLKDFVNGKDNAINVVLGKLIKLQKSRQ